MGWRRVVVGTCVALGCAGAGSGGPGVSTVTLGASDETAATGTDAGTSSAVASAEDTSSDDSIEPVTSGSTAPADTSSSSDGGEVSTGPAEEACDGEDNDGDGLVDEVSATLDQCGTCSLHQYEDHAYWACDDALTWVDARDACMTFGADLASILDADEDTFLSAIPIPDGETGRWLGGTDVAQEDVWLWVDGSPWNYEGWGGIEPNNFDDMEHHLEISSLVGGWADRPQTRENPYACKAAHQL